MASTPVEIPVPTLTGEFDAEIIDSSNSPSNVIPRELPWSVRAKWHLKGALAPILTGDWRLRVSLESMGDGPEGTSGAVVRDYQTTGTLVGTFPNQEMRFTASVNFPAGTPTIGPLESAAYRGHRAARLPVRQREPRPLRRGLRPRRHPVLRLARRSVSGCALRPVPASPGRAFVVSGPSRPARSRPRCRSTGRRAPRAPARPASSPAPTPGGSGPGGGPSPRRRAGAGGRSRDGSPPPPRR